MQAAARLRCYEFALRIEPKAAQAMEDWSATQYLKFEDDRTRPPRDLVAQVPLQRPRLIVDLGCGPGNSTELLVERFPQSDIVGLDSSPDMLKKARAAAAAMQLRRGRYRHLAARSAHRSHFRQCGDAMAAGPSGDHAPAARRHAARRRAGDPDARQYARAGAASSSARSARKGPWRDHPEIKAAARDDLPSPEAYYDLLKPVASHIDIWHSVYNHVMASPEAITEWFKGSSLQPFLSPLSAADREKFLAAYTKKIVGAYKPRYDGKVLLRFPRLFILAVR